jgi:hypothetical protein
VFQIEFNDKHFSQRKFFMSKHLLVLTGFCLMNSGCNTVHESLSASKDVSLEYERPEFTCGPTETVAQYSLIGSTIFKKEDTKLLGEFEMTASDGSYLQATRFDMCLDQNFEKVTLKQVVEVAGTIGLGRLSYNVYKPDDQQTPNPGLFKAISTGDPSDINISIFESPTVAYLIHGWAKNGTEGFVTISQFEPSGSILQVPELHADWGSWTPAVKYGELVEGDATIKSSVVNDRVFKADNLEIQLRYEMSGQVGMYVSYKFNSITIKDTNPALTETIDVALWDRELSDAIAIQHTHHSLNDSIEIKVPGATYRIGQEAGVSTATLKVAYSQAGVPPISIPLTCISLPDCGTPLAAEINDGPVPARTPAQVPWKVKRRLAPSSHSTTK